MFPTIAHDLADRDLHLWPLLAQVIVHNHSLGGMEDIEEQWEKFISELLSQLQGPSTENIIIVINTLDESGEDASRAIILRMLSAQSAKLPENVQILLTSHPLMDIGKALNRAQHVHVESLDDIDVNLTT